MTMHIDCPVAKKCGGCQLQNMDYQRQLRFKQAYVEKLLGRFGRVGKILPAAHPYHYRCKVQAAFGTTKGGKIVSGVYQSGSHRIVNVDSCMIEDVRADKIILTVRSLLRSFGIKPYNEDIRAGVLRHVLVRVGKFTDEIMVVLVTASPVFPSRNNFVKALLAAHPEITTVVQNINSGSDSMVLGPSDRVLYGGGCIFDELCGCRFKLSPQSFYQINPEQTQNLYTLAVDFAGLTGKETVLDAYCGTGTIGLIASKRSRFVYGAELNKSAVKDAVENAKFNSRDNIRFVCADAGRFMLDLSNEGAELDVVFIDPPRAGCSRDFLKGLITAAPERVVYISCNPETQARDLRFLQNNGYSVKKIKPVDMFPWTKHVECVVLMTKR